MSDTGKTPENDEQNRSAGFTAAAEGNGSSDKDPPILSGLSGGHPMYDNDDSKPVSLLPVFTHVAGHATLGIGISLAAKTAFCAMAATVGAPATATIIVAAAAASILTNSINQILSRRKAVNAGIEAPKFSWRKAFISGAIGAVGSGLFLAFGDEITDTVCNFLKGDEIAPVAVEDTSVAPAIEPSAGGIDIVQQEAETPMSAQDMKDEAFRLFNDGGAANDPKAVEMFNKAAEMGNYGARIDQAYIEHWGLAGTDADKAASIEKMKDVLVDMKEAGRDGNAEYRRGENLLNQWLGLDDTAAAGEGSLDGDADEYTRSLLEKEMETGGKEGGGILYEPNDLSVGDTATTPDPAPAPVEDVPASKDGDGMVEKEIRLSPADGSVGCEDGWVTLDPKGQMYLSCPLNGNADALPTPGTIMNVTPPAATAPLLGR